MTAAAVYPPALEVRAAGRPYPFPTWQSVGVVWRGGAMSGPNAEAATLALAGYVHPFVLEELEEAVESRPIDLPYLEAWGRVLNAAEASRRFHVPNMKPRHLSRVRGSAALAFLVADLVSPEDFAVVTEPWASVLTVPELTAAPF